MGLDRLRQICCCCFPKLSGKVEPTEENKKKAADDETQKNGVVIDVDGKEADKKQEASKGKDKAALTNGKQKDCKF